MSAEVQKQEKPKGEPKQSIITSVRFVESVPFAGAEESHASLKVGNVGKADTITPVCLMADGTFSRAGNVPANGVLLERKVVDRAGKEIGVERVFVFAANTRGLTFG